MAYDPRVRRAFCPACKEANGYRDRPRGTYTTPAGEEIKYRVIERSCGCGRQDVIEMSGENLLILTNTIKELALVIAGNDPAILESWRKMLTAPPDTPAKGAPGDGDFAAADRAVNAGG